MLLEKLAKKPATAQARALSAAVDVAGHRLVVFGRGDLIIKQTVKPDPQKMKNALAWMQRNAAKNAHRNLKETGSELLRKIRDGKIKA